MTTTPHIEDLFGEGGGGETPTPVTLDQIKEVGKRAVALQKEIDDLEKDLAAKKKSFTRITQTELPMMMVGISSVKLDDGVEVKISQFVSGSLPKEDAAKRAAIEWLEAHDGEGIIKTEVSVSFSKAQYDEAKKVAEQLEKDGLPVNFDTTVHPQTLAAYVRERMDGGEEVDLEKLGVFVGRVAKLKGL